jgi:hypothetical protein
LTRLGNEPLTTGALFLVAGAFLDLASVIVHRISKVQRGEEGGLGEIDAPGGLEAGPPESARLLIEAYLQGRESAGPYWDAYNAEGQAEDVLYEERMRILNATAAALFGNSSSKSDL